MKNQRYLSIVFDAIIKQNEVAALRAAIAEKVGFEKDIFHNHRPDGTFYYRYPKIQYKQFGKYAGVVCLGESIDEIYHIFSKKSSVNLYGREVELKIRDLSLKTYELSVTDGLIEYELKNWLALNQKNHSRFSELKSITDKIKMLERILGGHIISFAKGVDWRLEKRFDVELLEILDDKLQKHKDAKVRSFDIKFRSNIILPPFIGLGKGASRGFGIIKPIYQREYLS